MGQNECDVILVFKDPGCLNPHFPKIQLRSQDKRYFVP